MEIITVEEYGEKESPLLNKSEIVPFPLSDEDKEIVETLKSLTYKRGGVGLAAPQIGICKNIAVIYIPESAALLRNHVIPMPMHVIINASYEPLNPEEKFEDFEGCYSIKSVYGKVKRYQAIKVQYQDEQGRYYSYTAKNFYARVLQHEIDHLNGILFTDRLEENSISGTPAEMIKLRRRELSLEKREVFDKLLIQKGIKIEE